MWLVTSRFTVTLIICTWSTKIEQVAIFASQKPCKNETRKSNSAIDVVTQTTRTWSLLHSVYDHGPLRYGLKIGQINILEVPQGKLWNIPLKSSKLTFWGPSSKETNSLVLYEHHLRTKSKDHQWRHRQKSPDNIFSENDENREFVPQSSSTLTADISRTKTNFSKIPSKPFSGLQNLAIEVNLSRRFSWPLKSEKKYKNRRQAEYHHTLKGRKTLSSGVPGIRTWELSFMKWVCYQLSYPSEWKTENK